MDERRWQEPLQLLYYYRRRNVLLLYAACASMNHDTLLSFRNQQLIRKVLSNLDMIRAICAFL